MRHCFKDVPTAHVQKKMLQIVLMTRQPLTLDEINFAIGVNKQTLSCTDLELKGSSRLQETLSSRCDLIISIIGSKIYLVHQKVKEFLLDKVDTKFSTESI